MTSTLREIENFGGWAVLGVGTAYKALWPYRFFEVAPTASAEFLLPRSSPPDPSTQGGKLGLGHEVGVLNVGSANCAIKQRDGTTVWTVTPGSLATVALRADSAGGQWEYMAVGSATVGAAIPTGFRLNLNVKKSQNNVHVLRAAVEAGYDGTEPAVVVVEVAPLILVGSASPSLPGMDFGLTYAGVSWHASSVFYLINRGIIGGAPGVGGRGGIGGTGGSAGLAGTAGGKGIRTEKNLLIANYNRIQGGGGGGGGGGGHSQGVLLQELFAHGGGGGGGGGITVDPVTLAVSGGAPGSAATNATAGYWGSVASGGRNGVGTAFVDQGQTIQGGIGGGGGEPGFAGSSGAACQVTGVGPYGAGSGGGAAGGAGAAISRALTATVTFLVAGTVWGAEVGE